MVSRIYEDLKGIAGTNDVFTDVPMKEHTTFRVGGCADYFVRAQSEESLIQLIRYLKSEKLPYYILGNGSNVLFTDEGYRGVVVKIGKFDDIRISRETLSAGAGVLLARAAYVARQKSLAGMEFAAGIPGTVGGAVVMNAGAYGGEIKDILTGARAVDEAGNLLFLSKDELELGYRRSIVPERHLILTEAVFSLSYGEAAEIEAKMKELAKRRADKQPLEYPSAGSTFKRPEGFFAGKLIEDAGMKGFRVGGAQVSEKHSGFVINTGEATAKDILTLIKKVQEAVYDKFGVMLEMEVKVVK